MLRLGGGVDAHRNIPPGQIEFARLANRGPANVVARSRQLLSNPRTLRQSTPLANSPCGNGRAYPIDMLSFVVDNARSENPGDEGLLGTVTIYRRSAKSRQMSRRPIPSLHILEFRVVRLRPKRAAAPLGPPITPLASRRMRMMCSRSAS